MDQAPAAWLATFRQGKDPDIVNLVVNGDGEFVVRGRRCVWIHITHGPPRVRVEAVAYMLKSDPGYIMVFGTTSVGEMTRHREAFDDCVRSIKIE